MKNCHPAVNFIYFGLVLGVTMFCMHPVILAVSLVCAAVYLVMLKGGGAAAFLLKGALPVCLCAFIVNPLFSHKGNTVLFDLPTGSHVTLESTLYGISAGMMLMAVLLWFTCFSEVVTSEQYVYLFGKALPSFSLILSMTLRFIPRFRDQFARVREAQAAMGVDDGGKDPVRRLKTAIACFSAVVTWSLESSVETADSMKSRGYGTGKRTSFSDYRFDGRDRELTVFLAACGFFLISVKAAGAMEWTFFPALGGTLTGALTLTAYGVFFALCFMPVFLKRKEEREWRSLTSGI